MNSHRARVIGVVSAAAALLALATPARARADAVTDWNLNATNALIVTAGQAPPVSVLHLAMVHGAVYDAVNAIDGGYEPYLVSPTATSRDSTDAAVATAAYRVLVNVVPAQQPALKALYDSSLAAVPDGAAKTGGINAGEAAAAAMIAARTNDGRFGPFRFTIGTTPGAWRPTPPGFANDPNAWLKDVKPFLIESSSQFRSEGPQELTSHQYAKEFAEVKSIGSLTSTTRTADQTLAANYWAEHPTRTWSRIFRTLAAQERLSTAESARHVRDALPDRGGLADHRLGRQGALVVLASDHRDSRGRHGRQSAHRQGRRVAAADRQPAVSGPPLGPPGSQRRDRRDAEGLLRRRQDGME